MTACPLIADVGPAATAADVLSRRGFFFDDLRKLRDDKIAASDALQPFANHLHVFQTVPRLPPFATPTMAAFCARVVSAAIRFFPA